MSRFRYEVARPSDDLELRQLLAATPMAGPVTLSFRREPSFFAAAAVDGEFHQTVIARDTSENRIAALGTRSVRQRYVNGMPMAVGYLSGLRVLPRYRGGRILAEGYRFLKSLHDDGRAKFYLTTIAEGNDAALSVLTSARAGLPRYHFAGRYYTFAVPLVAGRLDGDKVNPGVEIRRGTSTDLPAVTRYLNTVGASRQFFPCYDAQDFIDCRATFRDLHAEDLLLATRSGDIVGMLACWDQTGFRQTVVEDYAPSIRLTRPLFNGWAALARQPKLPKTGVALEFLTGALFVVRENDAQVTSMLLQSAGRTAANRAEHILIGLHESNPLAKVVRRFKTAEYVTRLYYVCWDDGEETRLSLDERPPYLELGCL